MMTLMGGGGSFAVNSGAADTKTNKPVATETNTLMAMTIICVFKFMLSFNSIIFFVYCVKGYIIFLFTLSLLYPFFIRTFLNTKKITDKVI